MEKLHELIARTQTKLMQEDKQALNHAIDIGRGTYLARRDRGALRGAEEVTAKTGLNF